MLLRANNGRNFCNVTTDGDIFGDIIIAFLVSKY